MNYFWSQRGQPIFWTTYFAGAVLVALFSLLIAATTRLIVFSIFSRYSTRSLLLSTTGVGVVLAITKLTGGVVAAFVLACLSLIFAWWVVNDESRRNLLHALRGLANNMFKWFPGAFWGACLFVAFHLLDIFVPPSPGKTGLKGGTFEFNASFVFMLVISAVFGGVLHWLLRFHTMPLITARRSR